MYISALIVIGGFMRRILIILVLIFIISIIMLVLNQHPNNTIKNDEEIQDILDDTSQIQNTETKTERMIMLEELQKENSEIVAWLEIPNTNINYPVLQGEDNNFYTNHNYKKEYSKNGSLFLDKDYNWSVPSTNLLIYGHNNRGSKEMLADLMNYKNEDYYRTHPTIRFTTNKDDAEYEIISVFLSRVYYKTEMDVFRYYFFINAENEDEFNKYVNNSKKASLYEIEATAQYGEQLLTLSTCEFSQKDGRLAVVAKKNN